MNKENKFASRNHKIEKKTDTGAGLYGQIPRCETNTSVSKMSTVYQQTNQALSTYLFPILIKQIIVQNWITQRQFYFWNEIGGNRKRKICLVKLDVTALKLNRPKH